LVSTSMVAASVDPAVAMATSRDEKSAGMISAA
jgi:hypothetical protein